MLLLVLRPLHFGCDARAELLPQIGCICCSQQRMIADNRRRVGALELRMSAVAECETVTSDITSKTAMHSSAAAQAFSRSLSMLQTKREEKRAQLHTMAAAAVKL